MRIGVQVCRTCRCEGAIRLNGVSQLCPDCHGNGVLPVYAIACAECNLTASEVRELAHELEVNDPTCCEDGLILLTEPRDPEGWEGGIAENH